MVSFIFTGNR